MDINNGMLLWVTSFNVDKELNALIARGCNISAGYGFGQESQRTFEGRMLLIDGREGRKLLFGGSVTIRHSTTRGFEWVIRPADRLVSEFTTPFLLTNLYDLRLQYHGKVQLKLSEFAQQATPDSYEGSIPVTVIGKSSVGVLEKCTLLSSSELGGQIYLFAPQELDHASVSGLRLRFEECEGELGVIERIE